MAWTGLTQRRDFLRVQAHGQARRGRLVCIVAAAGPAPDVARLGFTVSRRVGNAVVRNRVRRRLRDLARRHAALLEPGQDYVWIALAAAAAAPHAALGADITRLLSRRPGRDRPRRSSSR